MNTEKTRPLTPHACLSSVSFLLNNRQPVRQKYTKNEKIERSPPFCLSTPSFDDEFLFSLAGAGARSASGHAAKRTKAVDKIDAGSTPCRKILAVSLDRQRRQNCPVLPSHMTPFSPFSLSHAWKRAICPQKKHITACFKLAQGKAGKLNT